MNEATKEEKLLAGFESLLEVKKREDEEAAAAKKIADEEAAEEQKKADAIALEAKRREDEEALAALRRADAEAASEEKRKADEEALQAKTSAEVEARFEAAKSSKERQKADEEARAEAELDSKFKWHDWLQLACEAKDCLQLTHGQILNTHPYIEDDQFARDVDSKLACVVFGQDNEVCFQSTAFSFLTGYDRSQLCSKVAWLQSDREWLELAINGPQLQKVHKLHDTIFADTDLEKCKQHVNIMISCKSNGDPFWNLRHVFSIDVQGERYAVHVLTHLEAPIPGLLWPRAGEATELVIGAEMLELMLGKIRSVAYEWRQGTDVSSELAKEMQKSCEEVELLLADALEGDHFVPLVGGKAVSQFETHVQWAKIYAEVESDLKALWAACDQQAYMTDKSGKSVTVACAIADPTEPDCPLVYVSPGFETLTGYANTFAQGRNCRFLQPNDRNRNIAFNGPELMRMKDFCNVKRSGQIFNLLLNESRAGEPFWNMLFMKHLNLGNGRRYILGVQTNIELQKDILDMMVPQNWTLEGLALLAKLREILQSHEEAFSATERTFVNLANEITARWVFEFGRKFDCFWEGDLFCPMVGNGAVHDFAGQWPELAEYCLKSVLQLNKIQVECRRNSKTQMQAEDSRITDLDQVVCAVADPHALDCPLVFISESFTKMTGYDQGFALGRNCRFLQPRNKEMNCILNGDECGRMKRFCDVNDYEVGDTILNLLLNERPTGERFWNLLHMTHVQRNGQRYILAVQTSLDIPMPILLKTHKVDHYLDEDKKNAFARQLGTFLSHLRDYLRSGVASNNVDKCASFILDRIMSFLKEACDDYAGDHYVPRLGYDDVEEFLNSVKWAGVCDKLTGREGSVLKAAPGIAFTVTDLDGTDRPLVYVSENFEDVTSYKREYALGRNGRFKQAKIQQRNDLVNSDELWRLEEFLNPGLEDSTNEQLVTVMLYEDKERHPFWCVTVSHCISAAGRRYLVMVHVKIKMDNKPEVIRRLLEILTMDDDAQKERARFRKCMRQHISGVSWESFLQNSIDENAAEDKHPLYLAVHEVVDNWARVFPKSMELPWIPASGMAWPCAALELGSNCGDTEELIKKFSTALSNGFRHIHFVFRNLSVKDDRLCDLECRLFSLRVAQAFGWLRKHMYLYIEDNLVCSIRTPPYLLSGFTEMLNALKSNGQRVAFWLLDVSSVADSSKVTSKVVQCWQTMSDAKAAGDVAEIGLLGGNEKVIKAVRGGPGASMTIYATDMYPGKKFDHVMARSIQDLSDAGVKLLACNCFGGQQQKLLEHPDLVEAALTLQMDPKILILRCLQAQGWMVFTQSILPTQEPTLEDFKIKWNLQDPAEAPKSQLAPKEDSLEIEPMPVIPKFTREFTRQFSHPEKKLLEKLWIDLNWADADSPSSRRRKSEGHVISNTISVEDAVTVSELVLSRAQGRRSSWSSPSAQAEDSSSQSPQGGSQLRRRSSLSGWGLVRDKAKQIGRRSSWAGPNESEEQDPNDNGGDQSPRQRRPSLLNRSKTIEEKFDPPGSPLSNAKSRRMKTEHLRRSSWAGAGPESAASTEAPEDALTVESVPTSPKSPADPKPGSPRRSSLRANRNTQPVFVPDSNATGSSCMDAVMVPATEKRASFETQGDSAPSQEPASPRQRQSSAGTEPGRRGSWSGPERHLSEMLIEQKVKIERRPSLVTRSKTYEDTGPEPQFPGSPGGRNPRRFQTERGLDSQPASPGSPRRPSTTRAKTRELHDVAAEPPQLTPERPAAPQSQARRPSLLQRKQTAPAAALDKTYNAQTKLSPLDQPESPSNHAQGIKCVSDEPNSPSSPASPSARTPKTPSGENPKGRPARRNSFKRAEEGGVPWQS